MLLTEAVCEKDTCTHVTVYVGVKVTLEDYMGLGENG